ncbi:hypothetical protein [Okeania sp. SIO2C9]|uniref:hypothetical protein n=1 Tax=Okeania sp. SIO2C9 TaxID=2607791 RepID=UPI0025FBC268|nr:hypothetical protein [Okeania sp. SIO2C9]
MKASNYLEESLGIFQEISDRYNEAICIYSLGQKYYKYGYVEKAEFFLTQALYLSRSLNLPLEKNCLELLKLIK